MSNNKETNQSINNNNKDWVKTKAYPKRAYLDMGVVGTY